MVTTCAFQVASASATVSVANPGINPNLVTLPDSGDLPAAFDGSNYAWFGDTTSGTFCGADWNTNANTGSTNTSSSKTGCTSREALQRFFESLTLARSASGPATPSGLSSPGRSATRRRRDSERAGRKLEAMGS